MHTHPGFWAREFNTSGYTDTGRDTVNGISTIMLTTNSYQIWESSHCRRAETSSQCHMGSKLSIANSHNKVSWTSTKYWSGEREHIEQACPERISSWRAGSRRRQGEETFLTIFFIFISDRSTNFVIVIVISKSRKKQEEIWKEKRK